MPAGRTVNERILTWATWRDTQWAESVDGPASPEEEARDDGTRAMRTIYVRWEDRIQAVRDFLGHAEVVEADGHKYLSRTLPWYHPHFVRADGLPYMFASQIPRMEGWGVPDPGPDGVINQRGPDEVTDYAYCKMQILLETPTYNLLEDEEIINGDGTPDEGSLQRFVTKLAQPSGQILPLPLGAFKYVDGAGVPVPGQPGRLVPETDVTYIWHRVPLAAIGSRIINPEAESTLIDDTIGKVNDATFPAAAVSGAPAGTLLLTAVAFRPIMNPLGERVYDVEYRMKYFSPGLDQGGVNPVGHNHLYRVKDGVAAYWEVTATGATNLVLKADNVSIYNWASFPLLFNPA